MNYSLLLFALIIALGPVQKPAATTEKTPAMDSTIFTAASWVHRTNVYEVNLRQYTSQGTFNAFAKELPRLKAMGVETLWFMPITPIAQQNKKGSLGSPYACSDYVSINPEFGNLADFKNLVNQAHAMGMKVIIDWVANHTGWDHVWTKTHPDYYEKDSAGNFKMASGMEDIIELDYNNPALRTAMLDAMKYWVRECDIDGYRCDLAFWVELDFWKEARTELEKIKKLFWLGEFDALEKPEYMQVFDACYTWSWMHTAQEYHQGKSSLSALTALLQRYDSSADKSKMRLWFTTNHDENSWNGTEYEKYVDLAIALAVFSFTWDGIPLIYSGQELPNTKRLQFFEKDPIEWGRHYALESFYHELLQLRARNPALATGDEAVNTFILPTNHPNAALAYVRQRGDKEVLVLLNLSTQALDLHLTDDRISGSYQNVFRHTTVTLNSGTMYRLKPGDYEVFER